MSDGNAGAAPTTISSQAPTSSGNDESGLLEDFVSAAEKAGVERVVQMSWTADKVTFTAFPICWDRYYRTGIDLAFEGGVIEGDLAALKSMSGTKDCARDSTLDMLRNLIPAISETRRDALRRANEKGQLLRTSAWMLRGQLLYFSSSPMYPPAIERGCEVENDSYVYTLPNWRESTGDIESPTDGKPLSVSIELPDGDDYSRPDNSTTCVANPRHESFFQGEGPQAPAPLIPSGAPSCEQEVREFFHKLLDQRSEILYCAEGWAAFAVEGDQGSAVIAHEAQGYWLTTGASGGDLYCRSVFEAEGGPPALAASLRDC